MQLLEGDTAEDRVFRVEVTAALLPRDVCQFQETRQETTEERTRMNVR